MRVKQAQLKVEETSLEAILDALHQECDAEAALAEANVYEAAASEIEELPFDRDLCQTYNNSERIGDYVKDQNYRRFDSTLKENSKPPEAPASSTYFQPKLELDVSDPGITPYVSLPQGQGNHGPPQLSPAVRVHEPPPSPRTKPQTVSQENSNTQYLISLDF